VAAFLVTITSLSSFREEFNHPWADDFFPTDVFTFDEDMEPEVAEGHSEATQSRHLEHLIAEMDGLAITGSASSTQKGFSSCLDSIHQCSFLSAMAWLYSVSSVKIALATWDNFCRSTIRPIPQHHAVGFL
jgi:hypothetical protein